jgi:uncharacterized protein (TIGR04255 family)
MHSDQRSRMTTKALGTWRHPPLAYVVAELVISPYYSMASKVPGIQDRLRSNFPRTIEAQEVVVLEANKPAAQAVWQLMSADQTHGVLLGSRVIALHATSYTQSGDFLARWAEVLDAVHAADLGAFVERAGLRYIDLIVPTAGKAPAAYLAPNLQGVTPEGARITGSMWAAAYQFESIAVNLRAAAPSPEGMLLPPAFNALPLTKPSIMVAAEGRIKSGEPIGFIDTDCQREIARVFDAGELAGLYGEMQKLASRTFQSALSNVAREEWT